MGKENELVDITATLMVETPLAWLINAGTKEGWVPKSQVEKNADGTFTMPTWLAMKKEFI